MRKGTGDSRVHWLARVALAVVINVPALASAQTQALVDAHDPIREAEHFASQAFEAYGKKDYAAAIGLYEKAYEAAPNADAIYNIARIYDLGFRDRTLAIRAYERFLAEPTATAERIQRARERATELRKDEAAARESKPQAPSVPSAPAVRAPAPAEPSVAERSGGWSELRVAALLSGAAGVTAVGIGFGLGLSVLSDADIANGSCKGNVCSSQRAVDAAKSASSNATLATAGVSIGGALIVTGVVLWLLDGSSSFERAATPGLRVAPVADASSLGMELGGTW